MQNIIVNIKETINIIVHSFAAYSGNGFYFFLLVISMLYINFYVRKERMLFIYPVLLLYAIIFFPITALVLMKYIEEVAYARVFWMINDVIICSVAATIIVSRMNKKRRVILTLLILLVIGVGGKYVFSPADFTISENLYKIPQEVIEVSDCIAKHSSNQFVKAVVPESLVVYIRQYNAKINLLYGRHGKETDIRKEMQNPSPNIQLIESEAIISESNYLVLPIETINIDQLVEYLCIGKTKKYIIFYNKNI